MQITIDNYEEYLAMYADGELQQPEVAALEDFIAENPHLKGEMELYAQARLTPDATEVFAGKEKLLKEETRILPIPLVWRITAIAAAVACVMFFAVVVTHDDNKSIPVTEIAHHSGPVPAPGLESNTNSIAPLPDSTRKPVVVVDGTNTAQQTATPVLRPQHQSKQHATAQRPIPVLNVKRQDEETATALKVVPLELNRLKPNSEITMPVAAEAQPLPGPTTLATIEADDVTVETHEASWFDKLPIGDNKKEKIKMVASALSTGKEEVHTIKENIREKSLTIKFQQKKFILSF